MKGPHLKPFALFARRTVLVVWALVTFLFVASNFRTEAQQPPATPASTAPAPDAAPKPDPGGVNTGDRTNAANASSAAAFSADDLKKLSDTKDKPASNADLLKVLDTVGQGHLGINIVWTLLTGFLVMFMQVGFAMVETGFCRAKNAAHTMMMNIMIYPVGMLGWWICGFAIMFGTLASSKIGGPSSLGGLPTLNGHEFSIGGFGIFGFNTPLMAGNLYDAPVYVLFLFQLVFMDTAATIPTGAMAERWKFSAFLVYGLFISIIAYPVYGHLMWGGGGLASLGLLAKLGHGAVDFAGSSVVHAVGGIVGAAGICVLGPRIGKYDKDGKPKTIAAHHIPMAIVGALILAFGWFGFNPGSTLGAVGAGNIRIGVVAVNTALASAGGAISAIWYMKWKTGKFDPGMTVNGFLAGLVAITAPSAFVASWGAVVIGLIAGALCVTSCFFLERKGLDDPVGAVSVHGVCGIFGLLSVGLFADGTYGAGWNGVGADKYLGVAGRGVTGLLYGDSSQLIAQFAAAIVCIAWSFGIAWLFFKAQHRFMGIRVTPEQEILGLDLSEMGAAAYPDFGQRSDHDREVAESIEPTTGR